MEREHTHRHTEGQETKTFPVTRKRVGNPLVESSKAAFFLANDDLLLPCPPFGTRKLVASKIRRLRRR